MENSKTRAWELYEEGRSYNSRLVPDQYHLVETNQAFFAGNQWLHLPDTPAMRGMLKPTFNILKRIASLFIASLTSSGVTIRFEPLASYGLPSALTEGAESREGLPDAEDGQEDRNASPSVVSPGDVSVFANAEVANLLEKFKFEYRLRDALFDGAQTGDYCAHFWFDPDADSFGGALGQERGEIRMELVDGINVIFGNPNDRTVENQPWILLVGRDTVEHLREEARAWRIGRDGADRGDGADCGDGADRGEDTDRRDGTARRPGEPLWEDSAITADAETQDFPGIGGQTEIAGDGGKALYVLLYSKEEKIQPEADGGDRRRVTTIRVTKATRNAVIYENVDTGLSVYPIAWGNWEKQKHQYHGRALVTGLIPNQIFINTMFATAMRHLQLSAFPKTVYNADLISAWSNEVGQAVGVRFGRNDPETARIPVSNLAATLPASDMSGQIFALIDKVMTYTRECLGATDAQMGNVRPDNTSALMVLQTNAEVPLENIRAGLHEWVEDVARILLDMMGTCYGRRRVVVDQDVREIALGPGGIPEIDPDSGLMRTRTVTKKVVREFDFGIFKRLWLHLRADVGATTYFSEIAMTQTLDNLRRDGTLNVIQYLERVPEKLIPRKEELIRELRTGAGSGTAGHAGTGVKLAADANPGTDANSGVGAGSGPGGRRRTGGGSEPVGPFSETAAAQGLPGRLAAQYLTGTMNHVAQRTARAMGARRLT